jgi:hypothetical protein
MPRFVTPDGRADLEATTDALIDHLRRHGRGIGNLIGARAIATIFDIRPWQATAVAVMARVQLRDDDESLCARTGPGGGYFIARNEEEARLYGLRRSETTLTQIENITKDVEAALRGVVRSMPGTDLYWRRTKNRLNNIAGELTKVRHDLVVAAGSTELIEASPVVEEA